LALELGDVTLFLDSLHRKGSTKPSEPS
jgi:hypothetical protein